MRPILLIRHGQSEWNAAGRWQGQADPPLSDLGRRQAYTAVEGLRPFNCTKLFCSALLRARTTAEILAVGLGLDPPVIDPRLNERSVGEWSGLTRSEIEYRWPGYLSTGDRPDGYELDEPFQTRVLAALRDIARRAPAGVTGVIAHSGMVYALEAASGKQFRRLPNLAGVWLEMDQQHWSLGERVDLLRGVDDDEGVNESDEPSTSSLDKRL